MKKILYIFSITLVSVLFIQCDGDDDNDNIIEPEATCNDGIQNGDEEGIDCGGSCPPCGTVGLDFSGVYEQEDQVGRPAIAKMYITYGLRDDFNVTIPSEMDVAFQENILTNLQALNPDFDTNGLGQNAEDFADFLSKDVLWVAQTGNISYYNGTQIYTGRRLQDDVMDFQLLLLYGGSDFDNPLNDGNEDNPLLISDGVFENDRDFLTTFPYIAPPF